MSFRVYNTQSKAIEEFKPSVAGQVRMYNCGPTVYGVPSIGNYRAFLFADLLRRHLEVSGYNVTQVMNITDVGHLLHDADEGADKLEEQARKENKDPWQIAKHYTDIFFRERQALHILEPHVSPKATDHIAEMISIIQKLIANGHAYVVGGNVYYSINHFKKYGQLSGNTSEQLNAGERIEINEEKRHPHDFALWKHDPRHIMQWDSPWGRGFPGWHIECSAMAMKYLGETLDLHTGGEDNIFPHHECEIAQSEAATGKPFVRYWMHTRFLLVNGEKMSKSKGNFYVLDDLTAQGHSLRAIRHALTCTHYRLPMNFTLDGLAASAQALLRLDECYHQWCQPQRKQKSSELKDQTTKMLANVRAALDEDLNMSQALAALFTWVNSVNKLKSHDEDLGMLTQAWDQLDRWFGFVKEWTVAADISPEVQKWMAEREQARKDKNFKRSDELRDLILKAGYILKDTPSGPQVRKQS